MPPPQHGPRAGRAPNEQRPAASPVCVCSEACPRSAKELQRLRAAGEAKLGVRNRRGPSSASQHEGPCPRGCWEKVPRLRQERSGHLPFLVGWCFGGELNVCQTWEDHRLVGGGEWGGWEQPLPAAQQDSIQPACPVMTGTQQRQEPPQGWAPWWGVHRPGWGTPVKRLSEEGYRYPRKRAGLAHKAPSNARCETTGGTAREAGPGHLEGSSAFFYLKPGVGQPAMATVAVLDGKRAYCAEWPLSSSCHDVSRASLRSRARQLRSVKAPAPPGHSHWAGEKCLNEMEVTDLP